MFSKLKGLFARDELKPIPLTMPEFKEWSERIIKGAALPATGERAIETQQFALASMVLELQKVESFKSDLFFVHRLRNAAAAQCALQVVEDLQALKRMRLEKEAEEKKKLADKSADAKQ
jgi:hypothetical protein